MDDDGLLFEFFAAEFGPDESQYNTHKEDDDGTRGVGDSGSDSDSGSGDESGAVGELLGATDNGIN